MKSDQLRSGAVDLSGDGLRSRDQEHPRDDSERSPSWCSLSDFGPHDEEPMKVYNEHSTTAAAFMLALQILTRETWAATREFRFMVRCLRSLVRIWFLFASIAHFGQNARWDEFSLVECYLKSCEH